MIPRLARCQAITKNANAAALLYRIAFWMPKATVVKGKHKWVVNDAEEWCKQTGLTRDQYRRAIALLRAKGLVVTEQHLFRSKNVTHVRMTELATQSIWDAPDEKGDLAPLEQGEAAAPEKGESAQLHMQGETSKKNQKGESSLAFANAHATGSILKDKKIPGEICKNGNGVISPNSPKALSDLLNRLVKEEFGEYSPPPTAKKLAQYKQFAARCPSDGNPSRILEACIKNWALFCVCARSDNGLTSNPARPNIGFLLRYVSTAVRIANDEVVPAATKSKPKPIVAKIAPAYVSLDDLKATPDELAEILDDTWKWKKAATG